MKIRVLTMTILLFAAACALAQDQGPMNTPRINSTYYVGSLSELQFYPTIQSAVADACASGGKSVVDIPASYTGSDPISGVTGGCTNAVIKDEHNGLPTVCYTWQSTVYSSSGVSCSTNATAANLSGTPLLPNGTTAATQSANDNSAKLATTAYADRSGQVGNLEAVSIPSAIPSLGVNFYRDLADNYSTDFDPDAYLTSWGITQTLYVDPSGGSDSNTGTSGSPFLHVQKAWDTIQGGSATAAKIVIVTHGADVYLNRIASGSYSGDGPLQPVTRTVSGQRIAIVPDNFSYKIYASTAQTGLSWTLSAGQTYTYQATRSAVNNVVDTSNMTTFTRFNPSTGLGIESWKIPTPYTYKSSIASVEANAGSWWTDGTYVYVHQLAGGSPGSNILPEIGGVASFSVDLANSAEVFLRNIYFIGTSSAVPENLAGDYSSSKFTCYNCAFSDVDSASLANANGISLESVMLAQFYHTITVNNGADGWNMHYTRAANPSLYLAFCAFCLSTNNGLLASATNDNAFTSHEGANIAVIASIGGPTKGPTYAFVNGDSFVGIGDLAYGSTSTGVSGAYYVGTGSPTPVGSLYLDDCIADDPLVDLSTSAGVPITLRDFTGINTTTATYAGAKWLPSAKTAATIRGALYSYRGTGSPEGVYYAPVGATFARTDGGTNQTNYIKGSGAWTNTGWLAVPAASSSNAITGDGSKSAGSTVLTVTGIQGKAVSSTAPTDQLALVWVAADNQWEPKSVTAIGTYPLTWTSGTVSTTLTTYVGTTGSSTSAASTSYAMVMNHSGTVKNCYVRFPVTETGSNYYTASMVKNENTGAPCGPTMTINSAVGVYSDTTNTCSFVAGDRLIWMFTVTGSPSSSVAMIMCTDQH